MFFIALSVAGAVIGAGFATGKEILMFFPDKGFIYLGISLLIMFIISILYSFYEKKRITDKIFEWIFTFFIAATFSVMLSCGGETINQTLNIPAFFGTVLTYIVCIVITRFSLKGIYIFSTVAAPLMILCIIAVSINGITLNVFKSNSSPLLAISYCGYNLLSLLPFLKKIKNDEQNDKKFIKGTALGIFIVFICGIFIKAVIDKFFMYVSESEIPMLRIALISGNYVGYFYGILVYCAILTTAVSCLYSLNSKGNKYLISLPLLALAFIGFEKLIQNIYTLFGYIGSIFIIYILLTSIFEKSERGT